MGDDGVSMSLDDYIKSKKNGGGGGGKRRARGGGKPAARGKGKAQQGSSKQGQRYFNAGNNVARGNQSARGGRARGGGGPSQRSPRGGVKNRNFNARNARQTVQGANAKRGGQRGAALQQQRGRNRVAGPRRQRSQELIARRRSPVKNQQIARRSPIKGIRNRGRRNERAELIIPRDRMSTSIARGGGRRGRGRAIVTGRNRQQTPRRGVNPTNAVGRLQNRTVQKLVQKRLQRARLTLTKKTAARPLRGLLSSRPRTNLQTAGRGGPSRVRAALAQQKLGRARQARGGRGRAQVQRPRGGLLLDRTQNVRIRVRNDQAVPAGTYTGYRPDPSSLGGGYNPLFPSQDYYGGDSFQFPQRVLNNSPSTSHSPPSHAPFQEVLNQDIQKKIAMIQERGKPAETDVSPDFRFVSASRMKLGERFRSLMK